MKEESKLKKINSEMILSSEIEKAFALPQNLSPIHRKLPSQSIHSETLLNDMEASQLSIKTPTFIEMPPKQQFSISNNIFNTHQCRNQRHQGRYLSYNSKKREIVCLRCDDEGMPDNDLEKLNESCDETIDEVTNRCMTNNCLGYPCFICLHCCDYICFNCLSNQHEAHKTCSVPYIANSYRDEVNQMNNQLKECVEQLNAITFERPKRVKADKKNKEGDKGNEQLSQILSMLPVAKESILSAIANSNNNVYQDYCKSFLSNDKETSDVDLALSKIKSQHADLEHSLHNLLKKLEDPHVKSVEKCEMRKSSNEVIAKTQSLIKASTNSMNKLTQLGYNSQKNNCSILMKQDNILKSLKAFEDSVLFSIKSGSNNNAIHLNRFRSFIHNSMIYFKTTSVQMKSNRSLHLTGLNMCCLYIHKQRLRNPNNELQKMENRDGIEVNVSLSRLKGSETALMLSEPKKLYGAVNANDPVMSIYFSNGMFIEKGGDYLITVDNLNTVNYYGDFWSGAAPSNSHSPRRQEVECNSTGIKLQLSAPLGIQSDFDEFSNGIIEGIIFTAD